MTAQVLPLTGELLSPRQVVERLGPTSVNLQQVYRWVHSGKLRAFIAAHMTAPAPQTVARA